MKPPVIIVEDNDISIHSTPEHAASWLEAVDVKDGIYVGYDCEGYLLDLSIFVEEKTSHFLWFSWISRHEKVLVQDHNPTENREEELRSKLLSYLQFKDPHGDIDNRSIEQLIHRVGEYMPWQVW